jgi:DNA primase
MYNTLQEYGFCFIDDVSKLDRLNRKEFSDLGLFHREKFLLTGRYIFPVRDMLGNVIALIGWYPDEKKYITTPSALFSKSGMFFGMEQVSKTGIGKDYVLVEGIFDSLSVRAEGFNCVAQMGISASPQKEALYGLFRRMVAIPDSDKEGRKVVSTNKWKLPETSSYLQWVSKSGNQIKDIDDLCKNYESVVVRDILLDSFMDRSRIIKYEL